MILLYKSWIKVISNPLFNILGIGLGLAFTVFFAFFKPEIAVGVSAGAFFTVVLLSLLLAAIFKDRQSVTEAAGQMTQKGRYEDAIKILVKAREKAHSVEDRIEIEYELGVVYYSMKEYQQSIHILNGILSGEETARTWKVYLQLAKAYSRTAGYYSEETLDACLQCVQCRKKFDNYGRDDFKTDIDLCRKISEIYRIKEDAVSSNKWFREEMILRDAGCNAGVRNKIHDLSVSAAALAGKSRTEDALRQYEEMAHLIEVYISESCDKYAVVQLKMGTLFWKGYAVPRYDFALECFQKAVRIKRRYMADITGELSDTFAGTLPAMQELCTAGREDIEQSFHKFMEARSTCDMKDPAAVQNLICLREETAGKCGMILELMEEVLPADSPELADVYCFLGLTYKWFPRSMDDVKLGARYLEKTAEIWKTYRASQSVQIRLARLLVDLGGIYVMMKDYETALSYRLEALKTVLGTEDPAPETVGQIELALKGVYHRTAHSVTKAYSRFLAENGISSIIEEVQVQPSGDGWMNCRVKLRGVREELNWRMSGFADGETL